MRPRLVRIAIAFAASLAAYGIYALVAAPLLEPSVERAEQIGDMDWSEARISPTKAYERLLAHYFPADSWVMQSPKLLESDQGILLIKDYKHASARSIVLAPFAMILFPSAAAREDPSRAGEAIVLEAPEALLDFDRDIEFSRAKIGNLKGGRLAGQVTIRSDQKLPVPSDDLLITTKNVVLSKTKIETQEAVQFRMGGNVGGGRLLRMHFTPREHAPASGANFGGIQAVELIYDVKMHFQMAGKGLLPAQRDRPAATVAGRIDFTSPLNAAAATAQPPIEITSQGPFRFDFARQEASFERNVDVLRLNPVGASDHLTCQRLSVEFAPRGNENTSPKRQRGNGSDENTSPKRQRGNGSDENTTPKRQRGNGLEHEHAASAPAPGMNLFGKQAAPEQEPDNKERMPALEVRRLRASGTPVIVRSPSTGGAARCERLEYDVKTGRVTLEDPARVMLRDPKNEISAPHISYQPGASGGLPAFEALGPGWLEGTSEESPPGRFRAAWRREMRLRPHEGQHILSVLGKAELAYESTGSLAAEEIWLWVRGDASRRPSAKPADAGAKARGANAAIRPDRLLATGAVAIQSKQLSGGAGRFEVWFAEPPHLAAQDESGGFDEAGEIVEPDGRPAVRRASIAGPEPPASSFEVGGKVLRVNVLWGERPIVDDVEILGAAHFTETVQADPATPPLSVRGEEIRVAKASSADTTATIIGQPGVASARGLAMSAAQINFDRAANRLYIDGPGEMALPVDRDFSGQPLDAAQSVTVAWQRAMNFDGQTVRYEQQVEATSQSQRLSTQTLQARLAERIDFAATKKNAAPKVATITCQGGMTLDSRTYEAGEQTAHDLFVAQDLAIDQITGVILANGPGMMRSHRRGGNEMLLGRPQGAAGAASAGQTAGETAARPVSLGLPAESASVNRGISFMEARFAREARGNLNDRQITFSDQIRCVYGPVRDWNELITVDIAGELPEGVVTLAADRLTVAQPLIDPNRKGRQPLELAAEGNAFVEGSAFTARAERMTYAEAKDLLVLEGSGRADALLTRQSKPGGPTSKAAARKILFWRSTGTVEVDDAKSLNLSQLPSAGGRTRW